MRPEAQGSGHAHPLRAVSRSALRLQSDERLVELWRTGSPAAFEAIVERYRSPLRRYCGRLLEPDEAEDVVQQTFVNALGALKQDTRPVDLQPWLYRISRNLALNVLSKRGRVHEQLDENYDGVPQPPDLLAQKERVSSLVAAIGELPERQRAAIVARELEGRSHAEIAQDMNASPPVVRQLIHRARTRLRDACGLLLPLPWLRYLLLLEPRASAPPERVGEIVAGGGAGASLLKAGAVALATGAIAAGAGGVVPATDRHHGPRGDATGRADAGAAAPRTAGAGTAAIPVPAATPVKARSSHLSPPRAERPVRTEPNVPAHSGTSRPSRGEQESPSHVTREPHDNSGPGNADDRQDPVAGSEGRDAGPSGPGSGEVEQAGSNAGSDDHGTAPPEADTEP